MRQNCNRFAKKFQISSLFIIIPQKSALFGIILQKKPNFSVFLCFPHDSLKFLPVKKSQKEAHGKTKKRKSVPNTQQKIYRRRPQKEEKQEGA